MESGMTSLNLEVISRKQICKQIGITKDTIRNWIDNRDFPKPLIASGRDPLFNFKEVKEWLHNSGGRDGK
jgi:excisionase family DNA binding protein